MNEREEFEKWWQSNQFDAADLFYVPFQAGRQSMHKQVIEIWEASVSEMQFDDALRELCNE